MHYTTQVCALLIIAHDSQRVQRVMLATDIKNAPEMIEIYAYKMGATKVNIKNYNNN